MKYTTRIMLFCLAVAFSGSAYSAQIEMPPNAALRYWQAFSLMGEFSPEDHKLIDRPGEAAQGEQRTLLVERLALPLKLLHLAASIPQCDWGTDWDQNGPGTLMPHLSKSRELSRAACLAAREEFDKGHFDAGIQYALDILALSRNVGKDDGMISRLVAISIEQIAIQTILAPAIPRMHKKDLAKLQKALDQCPPAPNLSTVIQSERKIVTWSERQVASGGLAELKKLFAGTEATQTDAVSTPEMFKAAITEMNALFSDLEKIVDEPYKDFQISALALEKRVATAGPLTRLFFPTISRVRTSVERGACNMAMLRAGIVMRLNGETDAANTVDPYGTGPFGYKATPDGFEFTSALLFTDGKPVKLDFHSAPMRPATAVKPPKPPAENQGEF
ncbi:MAG: hypothetical protein WCT04_24415 [Planctomycetota bacterium]